MPPILFEDSYVGLISLSIYVIYFVYLEVNHEPNELVFSISIIMYTFR